MQKFLRTFVMTALLIVPWITQAQNANVSEYDYEVTTANFASIATTGTAWTADQRTAGHVDVAMPFSMYLGTQQIAAGSTMSITPDGSVTFDGLSNALIAPLYYASGYQAGETSIYYRATGTMVVVEWRKVVSGSNVYSFQLKLDNNSQVQFCYGPMTINGSLSVFVGMRTTAEDVFCCTGNDWSEITRGNTYATRNLSASYRPEYNVTTGQGVVYTFTQPACVKPSSLTAAASAWNAVDLTWNIGTSANRTGFQVKYSDNATFDPETEGQVKNVTNATANTTNITGLLGATTYYFYLRSVCQAGSYSAWSPIASATTPDGCPAPTGLAVTTAGVVSWTASTNATTYTVKYGLQGFDPENEGTAISGIATTTATVPTAGFPSAATVDVYVQASCSVTGTSTDWVGPVSFVTPCLAITVNADNPYTEAFNSGSMPMCWGEEIITGSTSWDFYNGYAHFTYTPGASARLVSPVFNLSTTGAYQVEFDHAEQDYSGQVDSLWLYYRTSATAEWVRLGQYGNHSSSLEHAIVLLPNPSATYQLAFVSSAYDCYGLAFANVVVRTQPTCPVPSALAVSNVDGNNVTLSWTENGSATAWQIAYYNTADEVINYVFVNTNPYTVNNLGLGLWRFFVRSICSAGDTSDWYGYAEQNFGYCTPEVQSTDGNGLTHVVFGESMIVDNSLSDGTSYQNFSSMIGDAFRGSALEINLTYSTGSYPYGARVWVDWNQDLDFEDDGELVYTGSASMSHTFNINIPGSVALGDYRMRIGGSDGSYPSTPCGSFSWSAIQDYTIRVVAAPTCFKPNSLAVSSVTATDATLTWVEAGASTQWEVKLGTPGFDPNEEGSSIMVNTNPTLALAYLEANTNYEAYVRAICNPEGPTEWSNAVSFSTSRYPCVSYGTPGAEEEVTIGNGTTNLTYVPGYSLYDYSYTQQIYTADEIGGAGIINSIAFDISGVKSRQVDIYLVETDKSSFASGTDWVAVTDADKVFTGTIGNATGWETYTLTTPFNYTGTGNLVVVVDNNNGSWSSGLGARGGSGYTNMALYKYQDGTNIDPANPPSGTLYSSRNNLRLGIQYATCITGKCNPPQVAIALSETEYAATLTFTNANEDVTNPTYGIIWGPQGFNPETEGTTVSPISNGTYTISGLAAQTTYDVYVYAICGSGDADTVRHIFTTPFIPNCKTPVLAEEGYGASNITYNTADLTWRQPGDAPMYWVVRYATTDFNPATAAAGDYTEMTVTSASAQLTGLVAGTTYYIYVKSVCSESPLDESPWSSTSNANPAYTFTTPTCLVPTGLAANDVTNSTVELSWNDVDGINGWELAYGTMDDFTNGTYTVVNTTNNVNVIEGLAAYTTYYAAVRALCTATDASDWSSEVSFSTKCPDGGAVAIGNGTTTITGVPVANYGSTYCQQIFTADELREAGVASSIAGLGFNWQAIDASYDKYFSIWLANTDKSSFATTSDFVPYSELTQVYGPVFIEHGTGAGEQEYVFNSAFEWDGTSNIVVVTLMNAGASDNNASRRAYTHSTGSEYRSMYQRKDGSQYTEEQLATITGSTRSTNRANITFIAPCNTEVTCFAPASVSTDITTSNVVTINWAPRTDLRPIVNNYELKYGLAGFDPETAGILVSDLNDTTQYIINSELAAGVDYDVYVRTVCSETSHSKWTKGAFHTYPNCWVPDSVTITNPTQTSVTIAWRENTPTPATRWQIAYGEEGVDPDNTAKATYVETTNNLNYVLNGLHYMTTYDIYVRAICGENNYSDWSVVAKAITACGILALEDMPFVENFDGVTGTTSSTIANHVLPRCWDYLNTSTTTSTTSTTGYPGYPIAYNSASYSHSGNNHMRFYSYASTAAYGDQYAILPEMGFALDTLDISFYARESSTTATYVGTIEVGVMTDPDDVSTFEVVDVVTPTTTSYQLFEVSMSAYAGNGRYIALRAAKPTSGYNVVYLDDLTVKVRETINTLANNGGNIEACNAFVTLDTVGGTYAGNLNATYVVRPAEAGKVAHLTGDYDMENGYDFINIYRGTATAANLIGTYTGAGSIDLMTSSYNWADSGFFTIVVTSDNDNALNYAGFKFLVSCECPAIDTNIIIDQVEANGEYTWTAGNGLTYANHSTNAVAVDVTAEVDYTIMNTAQCDSAERHLSLVLHPDYNLTLSQTICERDEYAFFDTVLTTTGTYTRSALSSTGADSTATITLQVNPAPLAYIYYNNRNVTTVDNFCDAADMALEARSNITANYLWEDSSALANRVVNPHESNTYTVVATNPNTGCTSLPATLTVTTVPVADLTISGDSVICAGQSATLTVADANNLDVTYRWSNNATGASITVNPTETTTYTVTGTANNCQTTAEFTVTVNQLPVVTLANSINEFCLGGSLTVTATEVDGYAYSWNTGAETAEMTTVPAAAGNYTATLTVTETATGCSNEFTSEAVAVYPSYELSDNQSACAGMLPYTWGAMTLTEAGNYDQTFTIAHSCDSLVHLAFEIEDTAVNTTSRELCYGTEFTFGTGIYEQAYTATETGVITYVDTTTDVCAARYNLNLTVNMPATTTDEATACDTYTWNGNEYTVSGEYTDTLATIKGCDSVITMNLTVNYSNTGVDVQEACDSYEWIDGNVYTESISTPTYTLTNGAQCDSVVTLNLTVNYATTGTDQVIYCDGTSFTWIDGDSYNLSVSANDGITYTYAGANAAGCDSIVTLDLTMNYVLDTLAWADTTVLDELVIDTVACDNSIHPAYINQNGDYQLRTRNQATGQDQITRLHVTINTSNYHTVFDTACAQYTWWLDLDGDDVAEYEVQTYTQSGVYSYDRGNGNIEMLQLTINQPAYETTDTVVICQNGVYTDGNGTDWNGADLELGLNEVVWNVLPGTGAACETRQVLNMTVNEVYANDNDTVYLCSSNFDYDEENDRYYYEFTVNAEDKDTIYVDKFDAVQTIDTTYDYTSATGCDSTVSFHFTVNPNTEQVVTVANCYEYVWDLSGETYTESGLDTVVNTNENGCPNTVILDLTINTTVETHIDSIVCMSFEWQGQTYTENQSFILEDGLTAESGCDSVVYIDFIVKNHQLNNQVVVANVPYTWVNGVTYDSDTTNVFFDASPLAECDSVLMLTLTRLTDTLTICDNTLPYTTDFGYTVAAGMSTGIDNAIDEQGSGFYLYNIVNVTGSTVETAHGCQSYTWAVNGETYTEAGDYAYAYAADANGCVRVDSLHLTISAYNELAVADTACGSYTWALNGETYTVSGSYNDTIAAITGCDTVVTLNLVIPAGQKYEVTECYEYTWMRADSTTQVFNTSDSVGYSYVEPVSGCTVEDTLVVTINTYLTKDSLVVENAASFTFNNVLYTAPLDTTFSDTIANPTGCDSIINYRLIVTEGNVVSEDIFHCGNYQWRDGNVYGWISAQEATQHGTIFRYKNLTTGAYIYENPEYYEFDNEGVLQTTYVLWLTLAEAAVDSLNYGNVLASQMSTNPVVIGDTTFNFADEFAAQHDTTVVKEVRYGSTYYCDSIEYYTFNLVYNYTVYDNVVVCGSENTYNWREQSWTLNGAGLTTTLTDTADLGTADEWIHIINVDQYDAVVVTDTNAIACDSFTWNDTATYTTTGDYQQTYVDANGCDSVVTLHLTVNYNSNGAGNQTVTECYEYTWNRTDGSDSTYSVAGTHIYEYVTADNCPSVDTLVLTLNGHEPLKTVVTACDSYTWEAGDQQTYTASDSIVYDGLDNIGCLIHDTLVLTIKYSTIAEKDTLVNGTYAMIDSVMYEGRSDMDMHYDVVRHLTNAVGCDSTLTLHLTITPYRDTVINEIACGTYTWTVTGEAWSGNDHTYQWISAAERAANNDALYKDVTTNEYVYTYPSDTVDNVIYRLNLALNEAMLIDSTINFPLSLGTLTFEGTNFDYSAQRDAMIAAGTTQPGATYATVHESVSAGSSSHYCDSIYFLTVNLVNNYYTDDTTICYTDNFVYNGNDHAVNVSTQAITAEVFNAGTMDEQVITMIVTVRPMNQQTTTGLTACDSYTWNETTYDNNDGVEHTYEQHFTDQYGCDSLHTIYLTINHNAGDAIGTVTACDSYNFHGTNLTESCDTTITWTDDNGCEATDNLVLTIVKATPSVTDTVVCDNFHWVVYNLPDSSLAHEENYPASTQAIAHHTEVVAGQTCQANDTLNLVVRHTSHYDSVLYISDGSYRYHMQSGLDTMLVADGTYNFTEVYDNAEQCDSTLNLTFNVGTAYFLTENIISCDTFVWAGRTGDTYKYIDAETSAAHNNALYLNQTTGEYVMYNPVFVMENENDFDSIIMLRLTLTQIYTAPVDTNFNISNEVLVYGDSTFDFSAMAAAAQNFHDTTVLREVHFGSGYYCDSIINLYIHLTNNFTEVADTDICATATEVAWRGQTISTANTEYDIAHTYYIYDTLASGMVEFLTVNQHPMAYLTERRTACDSYTWEETGDVFTESTTVTLTGGVDQYGCPATTNLVLTINHSSSVEITPVACDSYQWTLNNAAHTVLATFTESVDTSYSYISDEGCASVDVLHLTVNHNTNTVNNDVVACDSYMWIAANGDTVATYTASGVYWYDYNTAEGCPSTDSLYLTINNSVVNAIDTTVCERIIWNNVEYISSGNYTQTLTAANGCDSTVTLTLHVGRPSTTVIDSAVCDSLVWEGNTYTVSGSYTDTLTAFGGCDSIVTINLTVNNSTNRAETAVACRTYHWDVDDNDYTASGDYVALGTNEFGCASNDTLHLTIGNNRTYSYENVENCGPYTWIVNGETIGTYEESIETSATVINPANGCDSIIFLTLTVIEAPVVDSTYTVCESAMPFTWRDTTLNEAGTASVSFTLASGCDSTINMTLVVTPTINTVLNENVCLGLGYNNNNFDIAASELPTAGTYTFVDSLISTVTGCDSIVTLNITVGDLLTTSTEVVACVNYDWTAGNNTVYNYTESGTYFTEPYINEQGCTSVDTLVLTISQPVATTDEATACDSYNWNGTEYTVSGEYVDTLATVDGCDSIVTLTLTVNNSVTATDNAIACGSYTWNNNEYTASGDYVDTLTAANGCDSIVTLTLVINMPVASAFSETACGVYVWNDSVYNQSGTYEQTFEAENGCDSVVTLTLTVNSASTSEETVTVCDSYTWNDSVYTESGIYTYTTNNASGCDSVATLNLTVNISTTSVDTVNACNYYEWNGTAYTTSGTYTYSATNAAGCDSTATLVLTINTPVATAISETACESYTWNNATYSTSGEYTQTFTAENGCDSVVTLSLTINNAVNASETATACDSYTWNGTEYTTSGNYTYTTTAANGCDSIVTLTLTINEPATETVNATACSSYTWNGQTYTASGIYTYNTTAANGCDSVVTLALTVNQPVNSSVTETACDSYTWNGVTYTTSGNYTYTGTAANGCDSVVTLALTINNAVATAETAEACDSYTWNGQTYTTSGTYTWTGTATTGCDSVVTLTLTVNNAATATETAEACDSYVWNGIAYAASGVYTYTTTAANGCDSVVTLNLTINQSVATTVTETAETNLVWNGVTYTESGTYYWTGTAANGCDSTVTLVLTINNSIYDTNYYTVAANIQNPGMGEVTGTGVYAEGSVVTLTATPNEGFAFMFWMCGNDTVTTNLQHTFTVVSDTTFTAVFVALPVYYTVTGVANDPAMGYVEQNPTQYEAGATAHLTAQANDGYHFVRWSNGETTPDIYFTVTCDITLTAYFEANEPVTGVEDVDMNNVTIYSNDTRIFVRGAEGFDVYVYDVNGRVMNSQANAGEVVEFRMPATGVYLVKVGNAPAKRVLVVR